VARLRADRKLRQDLLDWIRTPEHLTAIDAGTAVLPERFLATRATSVSPRGLARRHNRPFRQIFKSKELVGLELGSTSRVKSPAALIRRYSDRIGGIHIKDCFPDYLDPIARRGLSYHQVSGSKRLWAEPGLGVVDFNAVVAAMPADYDGDYMIEVDEPSVDSRYDSHRMSFTWASEALGFAQI